MIYNNLIANSSYINIHIYAQSAGRADNAIIYNNTIYGGSESDYNVEMRLGDNFKVYNNIICGRPNKIRFGGNNYSIKECDHNQFDSGTFNIVTHLYDGAQTYTSLGGWQSSGEIEGGSNPGNGSLASDPRFLNSSGTMSELDDFRLASDSPCKGAGRNGNDMGADISQVGPEISPSPPGSPPGVPPWFEKGAN